MNSKYTPVRVWW